MPLLISIRLSNYFYLFYLSVIFREEIVPEFWQSFAVGKDVDQKTAFDRFERAVTQLHARAALFKPGLQELTR